MARQASISPVFLPDEEVEWKWRLNDEHGFGIARSVNTYPDPVAAARGLAYALEGTLNDLADWIYGSGTGIRIHYDTLCPFGALRICSPDDGHDLCTDCDAQKFAAIVIEEEKST